MKAAIYGLMLLVSGVWIAGTHPYPALGWAIASGAAVLLGAVVGKGIAALFG